MNVLYRRFEILLPRRFNDGEPVPDELISDALLELEEHFGTVSCETQTIRGVWRRDDQVFRDELVRIFVDAPDIEENRQFFIQFKERAKAAFRQIDIWMTTYPIEVL